MHHKANFFIVGAPKAGTTSLYYYLKAHPDVYMSPIKETNFFSFEEIKSQGLFYNEENVATSKDYENQFSGVTIEKAIGEASVSYLFYPSVPGKIHKYNSEGKIIIVLRNPIERGFSHYLMDKRLGFVNLPYADIVLKSTHHKKIRLYYQQYVELGLYYEQVKRYLSVFPPEKIKIFYFEELIKDQKNTIIELYRFLDINESYIPEGSKKYNVFETAKSPLAAKLYTYKKFRSLVKRLASTQAQQNLKNLFFLKNYKPALSGELRSNLVNIYRSDIMQTSELLNKDLSHWLF